MKKTGELARLFDIDRTTLNYYVKKGLIQPDKGENQYHSYSFSDSMALAYIRYYRGLGFTSEEVMRLLCEDDQNDRLAAFRRKQEETARKITGLRFRQAVMKSLEHILVFMAGEKNRPKRILSVPYYFIKKKELEKDPNWLELYRQIPVHEFLARFNPETGLVELPDFFTNAGISIEEGWLQEFSRTAPENSVYHPAQEKYVVSWFISAKHPERELSEKVSAFFRNTPGNEKVREEFVLYLIPSGYKSENSGFDTICYFEIET